MSGKMREAPWYAAPPRPVDDFTMYHQQTSINISAKQSEKNW